MNNDSADTGFADLGLGPQLLEALATLGYEEPTPIQREAIGPLLAGHDLVGQAATGTGKTAAFALPILERVAQRPAGKEPRALVLVPTRELAMQVSEATYKYGRAMGAKVVPIYGGQPIGRQLDALSRGAHVVVATPGRALDHIRRGSLPLDSVQIVVLDEADEMLDMGFADELEEILSATPSSRQTVLFSATMPPRIDAIARRHLREPQRITIGTAAKGAKKSLVRQLAYVVPRSHKPAALGRLLDIEAPTAALVFCRTRNEVDTLTETLNGRGYRAEALHGGMTQETRDRVMGRVRSGTADLLVATDVAARGLDIDVLTHVVNYEVPSAPETYVHRIGRVGRAGREGVAITLAEPREQRLLDNIERLTKAKISIEKVPSVADLRARQLELTTDTVRQSATSEDLNALSDVVDTLLADFDLREIALAAIKLVHEASGASAEEPEIPDATERRPKPAKDRGKAAPRGDGRTAVLYFGIGTKDGIRPKDLVGAIANETDVPGAQIGPIKVSPKFATVGVPEHLADEVIAAMKRTTLKGHKPKIRRYVDDGR